MRLPLPSLKISHITRRCFAVLALTSLLVLPVAVAGGQEPNSPAAVRPMPMMQEANPALLGRSTAVALNYCRASFHRIKRCPSKRVLMEEQDKILNNLNLNQIADEEVIRLYTAVLDEIAQVQIVEKDKEFIRDSFRRAVLRRVTETGFQMGAQALTAEYVGMVRTGVNSWWDYRDMVFHRDNDSWRIDKLRMEALVTKSSIFLDTFWKMARKRSMDDRWLIRNSDLDELEKAMREPDAGVRLRVLKRMEPFMECYPPYWYYLARTQQSLGQLFAAIETYQKLVAMGNGHFRKDEMLAAGLANLSAIQDYLGQPSALPNARESLRRSLDVWEVNLMCARVLERHGLVDEAEDATLRNLDSNLERDQSRLGLLSLYYRARKADKMAVALENPEVVRAIPADALLLCASILELDRLPRPVAVALGESFYGYYDVHFGGRDLVLRAANSWKLEGVTISAAHGDQKYGNARLAVVNNQYEIKLRRIADAPESTATRSDSGLIVVSLKYNDAKEFQLVLQPMSGASSDSPGNGSDTTNILASMWKFRRNGYQLSSAVVGENTVALNPAARTATTTAPVFLTEQVKVTGPAAEPTTESLPAAPAQTISTTTETPVTSTSEPVTALRPNQVPNTAANAPNRNSNATSNAGETKELPVQKAF